MATVVLKLFAGQATVTDGRTKRRLYASPFGEHKNKNNNNNKTTSYNNKYIVKSNYYMYKNTFVWQTVNELFYQHTTSKQEHPFQTLMFTFY